MFLTNTQKNLFEGGKKVIIPNTLPMTTSLNARTNTGFLSHNSTHLFKPQVFFHNTYNTGD